MPTKAEQSEVTRAALVGAAESLFAERGFADTPTEAIVKAAGVTRGALYHHFTDKADLFRAVYESLERRVITRVEQAVAGLTDPLAVLHRGAEAFLDACLEPAVQRIVLLEGPTVLGWETWREIDMAYGLGIVTAYGIGSEKNAEGFRWGHQSFSPITLFDVSAQRVKTAAQVDVPDSLPDTHLSPREIRRMDRAAKLLVLAAHEAWKQSGWEASDALPLATVARCAA